MNKSVLYDLIVVGGGPAGLTATMYAIRKKLNVLMVSKDLGGKTSYRLTLPWVKDYHVIRGLDVVNSFKSELEYLNFARHMEAVDRVEKHEDHFVVRTRGGAELKTKAVLVASGAKQKLLDVPGEKKFIMRGLCYSAISYAPLFIDRTTVVVGDCKLALRAAAELAIVANKVHLIGVCGGMLETDLGRFLSSRENVRVYNDYKVVEVLGEDFAEQIVVESPDGKKVEIESDSIFVELGLIPNAQMVSGLVDVDEQGQIVVDGLNCTSVPGIFAAGDVTNTYGEQVLIAVGEGAKAALSAYEYLLPSL